DPRVSIVCFRVSSRSVEHAFDCVRCVGDVAGALDIGKRRHDQNHQERNNADNDQELEQRKSAGALTLRRSEISLLGAEAATVERDRKSEDAADPFDKLTANSAAATTLLSTSKRREGGTAGFLGKHGERSISEQRTLTSDK